MPTDDKQPRVPGPAATADWSVAPAVAAHPLAADDPGRSDTLRASDEPGAARTGDDAGFADIPAVIRRRFRNLRLRGRGGMGVVYGATDVELGREVAIKFVHGGDTARFLREARAQAKISHDNVGKIYDVGVADGQPYITMQLVRGSALQVACEGMTLAEKIRVIRECAAALHEAHRLGLVHRDVKPSNILVERGEDGTWKPYVLDFGLAREAGERGETMTGAVAGTPAYMAPEQARGEIRALDRRTDVYSLGATLFDILAGRTPFVDSHPWRILARLEVEDPPALRSVVARIPADLETIVMTCLERDPARRYDSARALGEDLQRWLDGEPVQARKASLMYRLGKLVRRHRLAVALMSLAFVTLGVFAVYTLRARSQATREAQLARELGEDVKEMQLFMRYAHSLPLHDVERERAVVRERLATLEARVDAASSGPVQYAIGRGYLALQEPANALEHLRIAQAGYHSPELEYAVGRAMVEVYREEMEKVPRIAGQAEQAARTAELAALYRDPAIVHLQAARGSRLEHPAYVEGLLALVEGRHADALRLAQEAEAAAPWFYEAAMLTAEAHYAVGSRYKHDAEFDHEKMMASVNPALAAYRRAAAVGTSDPRIHEWACRVYTQVLFADGMSSTPLDRFTEADDVCRQAIAADPGWARAYATRAFLVGVHAFVRRVHAGAAAEPSARAALELAEAVVRMQPDDAFAHWLVGVAWQNISTVQVIRRRDALPAVTSAIEGYEQALRRDPSFGWALNELASAYLDRADSLAVRGEDPWADLARGQELLARARQIAPGALVDLQTCRSHMLSVGFHLEFGTDPRDALAAGHRSCGTVVTGSTHDPAPYENYLNLLDYEAQYTAALGGNVERVSERAREILDKAPEGVRTDELIGLCHRLFARVALVRGESPATDLERARAAFVRGLADQGRDNHFLADVLLMQVRSAVARGEADAALFAAALAVRAGEDHPENVDPQSFLHAARVHERRAAWLRGRGEDPAADLTRGHEYVTQALARNPRSAQALATRGELHLIAAKAATNSEARRTAAGLAMESIGAALVRSRWLARELEPSRREAERIAAGL